MAHLNETLAVLGLEFQLGSPEVNPIWVAEDERLARYAYDDDVDEPYTMGGISAVGCVFLVVLCSGFLGLAIFYCSYKSEKLRHLSTLLREAEMGKVNGNIATISFDIFDRHLSYFVPSSNKYRR